MCAGIAGCIFKNKYLDKPFISGRHRKKCRRKEGGYGF